MSLFLSRSGNMRISLQSLLQSESNTLSWEKSCSGDELCLEIPQLQKLQPIQTKEQVINVNEDLFRITGKLLTQATDLCSRCLKEFTLPLSTQWDYPFTRNKEAAI